MSDVKNSKKTKVADAPIPSGPTAARRVRFLAKIEGAKEVVLTGDFTSWAKDRIKLNAIGGGEWETVLNLAPGEYQYRLLVDGEWKDHLQAKKRVPNGFGSENCVLTV